MKKSTLTLLGTGNAAVTRCYNTCFVLTTPRTRLLVDAGGGNGVLSQLEKANCPIARTHGSNRKVDSAITLLRSSLHVVTCKPE